MDQTCQWMWERQQPVHSMAQESKCLEMPCNSVKQSGAPNGEFLLHTFKVWQHHLKILFHIAVMRNLKIIEKIEQKYCSDIRIWVLKVFLIGYTLKTKCSSLASIQFHEEPLPTGELFPCSKGSLYWKRVLKILQMFFIWFIDHCSLKGSLGNRKLFFYGIDAKPPFWNLHF